MDLIDPQEIEKRSMEIISEKLQGLNCSPREEKIIKRVVHATAEPQIAKKIVISPRAIETALSLFKKDNNFVTDVNMLKAGISKRKIKEIGMKVNCYIARKDIADRACELGITRSMMSMRKAVKNDKNKIFVIGNAPTALFELIKLLKSDKGENVKLIIGTPVGFVGASESKEELQKLDIPFITVKGKKGGSPVAASITNALLYMEK